MIKVLVLAVVFMIILPIVALGIAIYTNDKNVTIVLTALTFILPIEVTIFTIYLIIELFNLIY